MRLTLRHKLLGIVGSAAMAFGGSVGASALVTRHIDDQLTRIEGRHVPKLEIGPQLEADLVALGRAYQDAVAAQDPDALARTSEIKERIVARLHAHRDVFDPDLAQKFESSLADYHGAALDVSKRLLAGEGSETTIEAIRSMQERKARVEDLLAQLASFDRQDLALAFAEARAALDRGGRTRLLVDGACLLLILATSLWLSHGIVRAVAALRRGFERFATAAFDTPIQVVGDDEMAEIARGANQMAVDLGRLAEARERAIAETQALLEKTREQAHHLAEQGAELERVSGYKSRFLASMSHELRTPLNSVLLLSGLLRDNADRTLTPRQLEYAQTINAAGRDLLAVINQVLDLAKIEAGKQSISLAAVRPVEVVDRLRRIFEPLATEKGLSFAATIASAPESFETDGQRLVQILTNLLGNAIKFTEEGAVKLVVEETPEATLRFAVTDSGPGVAAGDRDRLFAPFEQASAGARQGGTGLGLTIARELAQLLRGDVVLERTGASGSTFVCVLPARSGASVTPVTPVVPVPPPAPPKAEPPPAMDEPPRLEQRKVLVLDDDMRAAYSLAATLRASGAEVFVTDNQEGALQLLERSPAIDVVIIDPTREVGGHETIGRIRRDPRFTTLPVVALAPAPPNPPPTTTYLEKPVDPRTVLAQLALLAHRGRRPGP